jgi:hypothetical protein
MAVALRRQPTGEPARAMPSPGAGRGTGRPSLAVAPRRRRWPAIVIALSATVLVVGMLGAAVFHTQLAERQLRIDQLERAVDDARERFDELRFERAELRSPVQLSMRVEPFGMERAPTAEFASVTPEALARQLAAAGAVSGDAGQIIARPDPLDQFRDVKSVTAGER